METMRACLDKLGLHQYYGDLALGGIKSLENLKALNDNDIWHVFGNVPVKYASNSWRITCGI
jgi:hypothetical protein